MVVKNFGVVVGVVVEIVVGFVAVVVAVVEGRDLVEVLKHDDEHFHT